MATKVSIVTLWGNHQLTAQRYITDLKVTLESDTEVLKGHSETGCLHKIYMTNLISVNRLSKEIAGEAVPM